jgi:hypothetical protein
MFPQPELCPRCWIALTQRLGPWFLEHGAIIVVAGLCFGLAVVRAGVLPRLSDAGCRDGCRSAQREIRPAHVQPLSHPAPAARSGSSSARGPSPTG